METWKDIPGYESMYQAGDLGNIRALNYHRSGNIKILKVYLNNRGYLIRPLHKDGKQKCFLVHRLIGMTYLGLTDDMVMNHINGIKIDNRLVNLETCTQSYNVIHGLSLKPRYNTYCVGQYDMNNILVAVFNSPKEASTQLNIPYKSISKCITGISKSSHGFFFKKHPLPTV